MTESLSLLEFPCSFPIKAMGKNGNNFETMVSEIVLRHAELFSDEQVRTSPSGSGNFLSVTITINAVSRVQLDRIYEDLTACEKVLMAL
jgi:putative lipoic acid-binding regulatory protein